MSKQNLKIALKRSKQTINTTNEASRPRSGSSETKIPAADNAFTRFHRRVSPEYTKTKRKRISDDVEEIDIDIMDAIPESSMKSMSTHILNTVSRTVSRSKQIIKPERTWKQHANTTKLKAFRPRSKQKSNATIEGFHPHSKQKPNAAIEVLRPRSPLPKTKGTPTGKPSKSHHHPQETLNPYHKHQRKSRLQSRFAFDVKDVKELETDAAKIIMIRQAVQKRDTQMSYNRYTCVMLCIIIIAGLVGLAYYLVHSTA